MKRSLTHPRAAVSTDTVNVSEQ